VEHASRLGFVVDGAAYFQAFREAVAQAQRSVFILAWDIDSRIRLPRDGEDDGLPESLADFLHAVVARRPGVHIHVLSWDFAMIFAFERQWFPMYRLHWRTHRHLHFHLDGAHPFGASHHQKVVVVDDRVAFVGGLDLTKCRWDTPEHRPGDPRRTDPDGRHYAPFHDVQMVVAGEAAAALGELARQRWRRATGHMIPPPETSPVVLPWPSSIAPAMSDVQVGIARTEPECDGRPEVREVERLYTDAVKAARHTIYIETQYLTCNAVAAVLRERLRERHGPEVLLILPCNSEGKLEQYTMDILRQRVLASLRSADRHGRLGVYYPDVRGLADGCINVHSKVMIVDDMLVRVGTANLSNRSMGVDTECDLVIETSGGAAAMAVTGFRDRLLAEHLGVTPAAVAETLAREGSLLATVERLRGGARTLEAVETLPPVSDSFLPDAELVDPSRPLDQDQFADWVRQRNRPGNGGAIAGTVLLFGLLVLTAAWHLTPFSEWISTEKLGHIIQILEASPMAPLLVIGGFLVGAVTAVPVTVLNGTVIAAFGPYWGFTYALTGSLLSAIVTYGIGYAIGRKTIRRFTGSWAGRLHHFLARRGLLTVIAVRIVPVAPFAVVNLVAGASQITFRHFVLGTIIGMVPGLAVLSIFFDRVQATIQDPAPMTWALLGVITVAVLAGGVAFNRWVGKTVAARRLTRPGQTP